MGGMFLREHPLHIVILRPTVVIQAYLNLAEGPGCWLFFQTYRVQKIVILRPSLVIKAFYKFGRRTLYCLRALAVNVFPLRNEEMKKGLK